VIAVSITDAGPFSVLVDDLLHDGFAILGDDVDDARFGNSLLLLRRGATRIRVVKDRSQWFLEIAGPGSDDWFAPAVWLAVLDGEMPPLRPLTDEEQTRLVRDRIAEVDLASVDDSGRTLALLKSCQAQRAAARRAQSPGNRHGVEAEHDHPD
jgi:hypothetical protein